ncbi:MAG: RbsD/FucU family protein [Deferribacterota bacterium]|nr:RbsD/FucU family protein [Deferribacterota bacterium]
MKALRFFFMLWTAFLLACGGGFTMLKTSVLHPEILEALAKAGHGAKIVVADSNYPFDVMSNPKSKKVYLNLAPGKLNVSDVLEALSSVIEIESAQAIYPDGGPEPPIFKEYRRILPKDIKIEKLGRFDFYKAAKADDVCLIIATGEQRTWSCIILTIGVVQ